MILKIVRIILILAALMLLLFASWFSFHFYHPNTGTGEEIIFEVKKGDTASRIALNLKEKGVIQQKAIFILGYKLFFSPQSLKAGEYAIHFPQSTKEILGLITEGHAVLHPITIPEGLTRQEIALHLQTTSPISYEDFLNASSEADLISDMDPKASDLEGYLFPETYHFTKNFGAADIVSAMISQFRAVFGKQWQDRANELGMTVREIVILATLIEKETSRPEERAVVSSVFHNRLKNRMKLDCDPTIIYVLKQEGRFKDRLRTKDLRYDSSYNTYLYAGLPPGPIANPGKESLQAALYPAHTDYFYFVSRNDGSHHFSKTFREHQNAVIKYQKRR
ncbi:endolytic transglycosylase MltG [Acidobacteriota bacterium]